MSIQFVKRGSTCGFFFNELVTLHVNNLYCACQLMCILFLCEFLRVKYQKLDKTLSKLHTLVEGANFKLGICGVCVNSSIMDEGLHNPKN